MGREKQSCCAFSQERKTAEEHNNISLILATLREKGKQVRVNSWGTVWEVKSEHLKYVWSTWGRLFLDWCWKEVGKPGGDLVAPDYPFGTWPLHSTLVRGWLKVTLLQRWRYRSRTDQQSKHRSACQPFSCWIIEALRTSGCVIMEQCCLAILKYYHQKHTKAVSRCYS